MNNDILIKLLSEQEQSYIKAILRICIGPCQKQPLQCQSSESLHKIQSVSHLLHTNYSDDISDFQQEVEKHYVTFNEKGNTTTPQLVNQEVQTIYKQIKIKDKTSLNQDLLMFIQKHETNMLLQRKLKEQENVNLEYIEIVEEMKSLLLEKEEFYKEEIFKRDKALNQLTIELKKRDVQIQLKQQLQEINKEQHLPQVEEVEENIDSQSLSCFNSGQASDDQSLEHDSLMNYLNHSEKENKKENNFGDFFNCSGKLLLIIILEIDFQNNSQFLNDQSEILIGENGEKESPKTNKYSDNDNQAEEQNDRIILQELQEQVIEENVMSDNQILMNNPDIVEKDSSEQVMSPTLQIVQTRNIKDQNSGSFRRKTKEQMLIEPLPVFDCMFCVTNEKFVLRKVLEIHLHKKYQNLGTEIAQNRNSDIDNPMIRNLLGSPYENNFITVQEQEELDQETYLRSQIALQIMINQNPNLRQHLDEEFDTIHDFSPIMQRKLSNNTLQNFSQFIPHPQLQVERSAFDQKKCFIQIKIAQIMSQSRRKSQSGETFENIYATSPTYLGNDLGINTLLFNSKQDKKIVEEHQDMSIQLHEIKTSEPLLNLNDMMDEPIFEKVNIYKWARNRRQKTIKDISFDSDIHNIYNPKYSSEEEDSLDMSLLREENQEIKITHDKSSDSNMSIAEERDTISLTANAITPNLSRVINHCSISKMEQLNLINVISSHYNKIQESQRQSRYTQQLKKHKKEVYPYQLRSYAESVITQERNSSPKDSQNSQQQSLRPRSFLKHESISSISSFANNISNQNSNQNQLYIQLLKPFLNRQKQKVKIKAKRNETNQTGYINNPSKLMLSSQNNQSQNQNIIYKSHIIYNDTSNTIEPLNSLYSTPMHGKYKKNTVNDQVKKEAPKPRTKSLLKNSQSHSNLTIQPRAFITRNVKIRQSQMGVNDGVLSESPHQKQQHQQKQLIEVNKSPNSKQLDSKVDFRLQNKRQKLQRDILLSKVYTHGHQLPPQTGAQHKKNKSINPNFEQIRSSGQSSKLSLQFSKQKSSLQLDPLNQLKSKQSMKQLPSTTKSYKSPIDSIKMPTINNFLK